MIMNFAFYNKWLLIGSANQYSKFQVAQQSVGNKLTCSIFDKVLKAETLLMPMNFINKDLKNASWCRWYDGYGKLFDITPNKMAVSFTLN